MNQEEVLAMVAEVRDKYSRPLRALREQLQSIRAPKEVGQIQRDLSSLGNVANSVGSGIRSGFTPALAGVGLAGFGVASAISATIGMLQNLNRQNVVLRRTSRETGLTTENLRELQAIAKEFDIAPDAAMQGVKTFTQNMYELRRGTGELTLFLRTTDAGRQWAKQFREANTDMDRFRIALDAISRQRDPVKRRALAEALGLGEFSGLTDPGQVRDAMSRSHRQFGMPNPALDDSSRKLNDTLKELEATMGRIANERGPGLIEFFNDFLREGEKVAKTTVQEFEAIRNFLRGNTGERGAQDHRNEQLREKLAERDRLEKAIAARRGAGAPDSALSPLLEKRLLLDDQIRQLEDKIKDGARDGVKEGIESLKRMSYSGGGGFGGMVREASYHPAGGPSLSERTGGTRNSAPWPGEKENATEPLPQREAVGKSAGERLRSWNEFLQKRMGLTPESARGVIGNFQGESGQNLNPLTVGDSGTSFGVAQWRGPRAAALRDFAAKHGLNWRSTEGQQEFFLDEMRRKYPGLLKFLRENRSGEAATRRMVYEFERPKYPEADTIKRQGFTRRLQTTLDKEAAGGRPSKVEGSANLRIDLNGFPKGTRMDLSTGGGLFEMIELNRAPSMSTASEAE